MCFVCTVKIWQRMLKDCVCSATGAFAKRSLATPANPHDLYDPVPGKDGALPFKMAHTERMK